MNRKIVIAIIVIAVVAGGIYLLKLTTIFQ